METLTFLNSPLLWGLLLASIPLLIHLLFRRQYRRVDWAPMRYLKLSIQRNRRRIRLEQILLLLLRTALVLLLFFLVARPVMHAEGLSRWLGTSSRTNRIVVIDDSLSMGYSDEGKTALARGQDVLAELLPSFGADDRLTLVLASRPRQPLAREIELIELDEVIADVRSVKPCEGFASWEPILEAVDELIAGASYPLHEVTLVTDLRQAGWEGSKLPELATRWAAGRVHLRVFDVGKPQTSNVALVGLDQVDRLALVATPTRFEAEVRNDTLGELASLEANFIVDGKASLVRVPAIAAGDSVRIPLLAMFQEPNTHDVAFELPYDNLAGDNRAAVVVSVQQNIDMLLVDGEPSTDPLGGETDYLALALSLAGETAEPFRVEVVTDSEWASSPAAHPDLAVLANVARLTPEQAEMLEREVAAGMGLMIFVGDQLDPDNYNQLLFKEGGGLLPAAFEGIADAEFSGILVEPSDGSPLAALGQLTAAALERIKVRRTYEVRLPTGEVDNIRVLARWNNQAAAPAIIEKVFGDGRVLLWTTAADRSWSDWPTDASYVLAAREAARAVARSLASRHQYTAGQSLSVELPASHDITLPTIEVPEATEPKGLALADDDSPTAQNQAKVLSYADTARAGLYKMSWRDSASGAMSETFAVNPDRRESDLRRIPREDFKLLWGALEPEVISIGAAESNAAVTGQEIWRTLATGMLGLLVVEACFARWAGRPR